MRHKKTRYILLTKLQRDLTTTTLIWSILNTAIKLIKNYCYKKLDAYRRHEQHNVPVKYEKTLQIMMRQKYYSYLMGQ